MNIVITGGNSYLGHQIVERLKDNEELTIFVIHSNRINNNRVILHERVVNYRADLTQPLCSDIVECLKSADLVFHFAWVRGKGKAINLALNERIVDNILSVTPLTIRFYFISSVGGTPKAKSDYGQNKYRVAQRVQSAGGNIILVGLVVEVNPRSGPYAMLYKQAQKYPLSFRVKENTLLVFPISIENFFLSIQRIIHDSQAVGVIRAFEAPVEFNLFIERIERMFPKKRIRIPMNATLLLRLAIIAKRLFFVPTKICDQILTFFYKDVAYLNDDNTITYDATS